MRDREYTPNKDALVVEIQLSDGGLQKGKLWVPVGKTVVDVLNSEQPFVQFDVLGDDCTTYLAKAHIVSVRAIDIPKFVPMHERRGAAGGDDPYQILGVSPATPLPSVREAYIRLVKAYHPDRFSGVDLPNEVTEYLGAKVRRINAAFALLEGAAGQACAAS
jgi:hypothetical protein